MAIAHAALGIAILTVTDRRVLPPRCGEVGHHRVVARVADIGLPIGPQVGEPGRGRRRHVAMSRS